MYKKKKTNLYKELKIDLKKICNKKNTNYDDYRKNRSSEDKMKEINEEIYKQTIEKLKKYKEKSDNNDSK